MTASSASPASEIVRTLRQGLGQELLKVGPDAPTLCEGWNTTDLAAHLVIREARPDAALGIIGGPLAWWTRRVQNREAQRPYAEIVGSFMGGPPTFSPFRISGLDASANLFEYFIHGEDVRRAQPGWEPRVLPDEVQDLLWSRLSRSAGTLLRRVPTGLTLERTGNESASVVVRQGPAMVTVRGDAGELVLRSYGRAQVRVVVSGDPDAIASFEATKLGA